jgi:Ser/Thr protein kinase RdoA (MazF antagonist)
VSRPGTVIQEYVERAFGRFVELRGEGEPPLTPWTKPPTAGLARVKDHLTERYGVAVRKLGVLDCGVFRVDRADGSTWVARVFPPARSLASVERDAALLRYLGEHDFPAERLADDEPVTVIDGNPTLVTLFFKGKSPGGTAATGTWQGDALGRLHTLPLQGAPKQVGGGWHALSLDGGGRAADLEVLAPLLADLRRLVPTSQRQHVDAVTDALAALDLCEGLPQTLVHADFGGPNVLRSTIGEYQVIDWAGAGRGPRIESVGAVLGPLPPAAQKAAISAYRQHVDLTEEELDRLEGTLLTHQLVLACWGVCMRPDALPGLAAQLPKAGPAMHQRATAMRKAFSD